MTMRNLLIYLKTDKNLQKISSQKDVGVVERKIETFEQKLQILIKVIEEKDSLINELQNKQTKNCRNRM